MRRLAITVTLCAAFLLAAACAAAASPRCPAWPENVRPGGGAAEPWPAGLHESARFAPLGARLSTGTTVSGTVYDSYHTGLANVGVEWHSLVDGALKWGTGSTDGGGSFAMTAQPTEQGELWAVPDELSSFARTGRSWIAGGSDAIPLYPGRVSLVAYRGGRWADAATKGAVLRLFGDTELSRGTVLPATSTSSPISGTVDVLDGVYSHGGSVKFFSNEGAEFARQVQVTSGATTDDPIVVDEADAQRVWLTAPYWWSGRPGATITVARNNFPAGWRNLVYGYNDDPRRDGSKLYGIKVSQGRATENLRLRIPIGAKPGYAYCIGFQHVDEAGQELPLQVLAAYQVCTLKPSRSSIPRGAAIKLKGIIPTQGHWGSQTGHKKPIAVWWHKGTAPVPKVWYPDGKGWILKVAQSTSGTGAFTTPSLRPVVSGTFVVQFPSDGWYWGGYTSAVKVTVR